MLRIYGMIFLGAVLSGCFLLTLFSLLKMAQEEDVLIFREDSAGQPLPAPQDDYPRESTPGEDEISSTLMS